MLGRITSPAFACSCSSAAQLKKSIAAFSKSLVVSYVAKQLPNIAIAASWRSYSTTAGQRSKSRTCEVVKYAKRGFSPSREFNQARRPLRTWLVDGRRGLGAARIARTNSTMNAWFYHAVTPPRQAEGSGPQVADSTTSRGFGYRQHSISSTSRPNHSRLIFVFSVTDVPK